MPRLTRRISTEDLTADAVERVLVAFRESMRTTDVPKVLHLGIHRDDERWEFEESDEFLRELERSPGGVELNEVYSDRALTIASEHDWTDVAIRLPSRQEVDAAFAALGSHHWRKRSGRRSGFKVFIGHGRSPQWRVLTDHLVEKHGLDVVTYENSATVGQPAMSVLAQIGQEVAYAILVHTAEGVSDGERSHAGFNVIHETGYFQALLGPSRSLILREDGCQPFTNVAGLTELRFRAGSIAETFGYVVSELRSAQTRA